MKKPKNFLSFFLIMVIFFIDSDRKPKVKTHLRRIDGAVSYVPLKVGELKLHLNFAQLV